MTNTRKRHTPEQVVRKLVEADRLLAGGADTAAVARQLGVAEQTYFRWRNQFGGLKAEDAKELKKLRAENQRLKRLLADAELDKDMLREVAKGGFRARPADARPLFTCVESSTSANGVRVGWSGSTDPPNATPRPRRLLESPRV